MGGTSTQQSTQSSTTAPWEAAQPALSGILGQLNGLIPNSGLSGAQTGAINTLEGNASAGNPYAPAIGNYATSMLNGGGANNQAGALNNAYQQYYAQTNPLASNTNYDPMQTPGIGTALQGLSNTITTGVNGSFAAAGRDGSPANSQSTAYGLAQGLAPILTGQYNQNVQNQQAAAGNQYGAATTNAGLLSGMQQQYVANQGNGINAASSALDANNYGANATLAAEAQRTGIPIQTLGLLTQMGVPIAGLGSQSTGQSSGTSTMSGAQQFGTIASGIGNVLGGAGNFFKYMPSDRRLKQDVEQVGTLFDGQPVYGYYYRGSPTYTIGLIAQEVDKVNPAAVAVVSKDGNEFMAVDYHKATETSRKMKKAAA